MHSAQPLSRSSSTPGSQHARRSERGASAVEWVVITALLIGIALAVGAVILTKTHRQGRLARHHHPVAVSPSRTRSGRAGQRGASSVELAMYMPILLFFIFVTVQFALVHLGNQAASAVAREAARVARTNNGDTAAGEQAGYQYAANIGKGILEGVTVRVTPVGGDRVRAVVTGHAQELSPIGVPEVSETVVGPIEEFREDTP